MNFREWVLDQTRRINSDGCTLVSEWHHECCLWHDLACFYGKDPHSAYNIFRVSGETRWDKAKRMPRRKADYGFLDCNAKKSGKSPLGLVRSILRFVGVRAGAVLGFGTMRVPSFEEKDK